MSYMYYDKFFKTLKIHKNNKIMIDEFIEEFMTKDKFIGSIILEELAKKVFHPERLLRLSKESNINFDDYIEIF